MKDQKYTEAFVTGMQKRAEAYGITKEAFLAALPGIIGSTAGWLGSSAAVGALAGRLPFLARPFVNMAATTALNSAVQPKIDEMTQRVTAKMKAKKKGRNRNPVPEDYEAQQ
jgi:hypothetical protein